MKKIVKFILSSFSLLSLCGCGGSSSEISLSSEASNDPSLPGKGSTVQDEDLSFSPKSVVGYVGDPMPYFSDGVMNVFYLQDGRNTNLGYHPIALMETTDNTSFKDYGAVLPYVDNIYDPDLAIGTGSVIKDESGLYHCFYTGHNDNKSSGLPYYEKIQHATSPDKKTWTKIPADGFYGGTNDFRDPYVTYMKDESLYWMLVATRASGRGGALRLYKSSDLHQWSDFGYYFYNDSGSYTMECPTLLNFAGCWYLSYSEQGSNRVTHYRYRTSLTSGSWQKPDLDYFDSEGFYAGRMEKMDNRLFIYGWCATKSGEYDGGDYDWAGNLVVHELKTRADHTLYPSLPKERKSKLNHRVYYKDPSGNFLIDGPSFSGSSFSESNFDPLSKNKTLLSFTAVTGSSSSEFGLSFGAISSNEAGSLGIVFAPQYGYLSFNNNFSKDYDIGVFTGRIPLNLAADGSYKIDVIIDGMIVTVYVNDEVALTSRLYDMPKKRFGFFAKGGDVTFKEVAFYE